MLFRKQAAPTSGQKPNIFVVAILIAVILVAGFMLYRTVAGSGGASVQTGTSGSVPEMSPAPSEAALPAKSPSQPIPPAPSPKPTSSGLTTASRSYKMREIKVFGNVSISYPASWKITVGGGNVSAVFTDGNALFEVHPPDPKATTAKSIAEAGLKALASGAQVIAQGSDKIAGYDSYWIAVKTKSGLARVVGVDGPIRVLLFEHVKDGSFSAYRDVFDNMQSTISFR
ncbi:MAG: hypothetical protein N3B12_08485 [Armatimonadetes bacterium]|nr:hypothetical protein [Armatimonadota bacterium]